MLTASRNQSATRAEGTAIRNQSAMRAEGTVYRKEASAIEDRSAYAGTHILAGGIQTETDTWKSGINNNVLVFGPTGAGKTRGYVKPNIRQFHESMIISDTKGNLIEELAPELTAHGYRVLNINMTSLTDGCGYNPLDYVRRDANGHLNEQDIMTITACLVDRKSEKDPFWDLAARQYLSCILCYMFEALPEEDRTLGTAYELLNLMQGPVFRKLITELSYENPDSTAVKRYRAIRDNTTAEKMDASIRGILAENLEKLSFGEADALYRKKNRIRFEELGRRKTALFLTISDMDRAQDKLANLLMTQALQVLVSSADHDYKPFYRLPVPVRLYLDDFATNLYIPDFDKIISVIRSREIYVSVILQSLSQLTALYGNARAETIINNCDQQLYLGGQDIETARYISLRVNQSVTSVLNMPADKVWVFRRSQQPVQAGRFMPA